MHLANKIAALLLIPVFLLSSPALAQQIHVVDAAAMNRALADKAESERGQRDVIRRVLERDDARQLAAGMGLNLADASAAVATLGAAELAPLAAQANAVEAATLAGGVSTMTISLTTLLLVLIIVILIVK
jgi:hypothetical protein